eukprot:Clim_evm190s157 gene=Clim_evmTU190s157
MILSQLTRIAIPGVLRRFCQPSFSMGHVIAPALPVTLAHRSYAARHNVVVSDLPVGREAKPLKDILYSERPEGYIVDIDSPSIDFDSLPEEVKRVYSLHNANAKQIKQWKATQLRKAVQLHDMDVGSAPVQIAKLSVHIHHLEKHLEQVKKDHHAHRQWQILCSKRHKHMRYLKRVDFARYMELIRDLGISNAYTFNTYAYDRKGKPAMSAKYLSKLQKTRDLQKELRRIERATARLKQQTRTRGV